MEREMSLMGWRIVLKKVLEIPKCNPFHALKESVYISIAGKARATVVSASLNTPQRVYAEYS